MSNWEDFFVKARHAGVSIDLAMRMADEEFPRGKVFPGPTVPVPKPREYKPPLPPVPVPEVGADGEKGDWVCGKDGVPAWVRRRHVQATDALGYEPPKRTKALPLTEKDISNALGEHFAVAKARELDGLDVWFVLAIKTGSFDQYEIILYEHMGEWVCSSVTKLASEISWDLANFPDRTIFTGKWSDE